MIQKYSHDPKVDAIHRLRVNVKSLAAEAAIIRREARRAGPPYACALDLHRRTRLREEARYAQLALAFVRGRRYRQVEVKIQGDLPSSIKLREKLSRFLPSTALTEADVTAWLREEK
jgi:hypothetical protein